MSSTPDPTKEIKVTNNSGTSIVIMLPTTSTQTTDANGTMVYGQSLEVLTAVDGTTAVANNATETFVLDQTYTDPDTGDQDYSTIYDLLPSTANWYAPVANIGVMQSFTIPASYPAQTVTAAGAAAFQNAGTFVQTISAYPSSGLATSYQQALGQATTNASGQANGSAGSSDAVAGSISDATNAFFAGTKTFQNVTLEAVVAVQSYYASFPFVWAEFAASTTTYYLYSSNGTATSFVGTLSLTPPKTVNIAVANGGYTCTFTPASNGSDTTTVNVDSSAAKSLTYTNGLFVDNVDSDIPQVAIKGTFQIKSTFTGKSTDTQIITVLTGTVDNATCIGFDSPQLSQNTSDSFWDTLFHPKNSAQIFQSIMQIGGAVMLLAFVGQSAYGIYKWARGLGNAKQPTTQELLDQQMEKFQKSQKDAIDDLVKKMSGGKENPPASPDDAQTLASEQTSVVADNQSAIKLQDGFQAQADSLQELAEFAPEMTTTQLQTLEKVGGEVQKSATALEQADPANLGPVVEAQTPALQSVSTQFSTLETQVSSSVSESAKASIAENTELVNDAHTQSEEIQDNDEGLPDEDAPAADDPIMPEL
jgi:hypothetical protein